MESVDQQSPLRRRYGLDVTPGMIERLVTIGDTETAARLRVILREEVGHVAARRIAGFAPEELTRLAALGDVGKRDG